MGQVAVRSIFFETQLLKRSMAQYLEGKISPREFSEATERFERAVQEARGGQPIDLGKKP